MRNNPLNLKFIPSPLSITGFIISIIITTFLFFGRRDTNIRVGFFSAHFTDFYHHISNFTISYNLFATISLLWLAMGLRFKNILWLGAFFILANFLIEMFVHVLNTPDITDAYYGTAGVAAGLVFLFFVKAFGLIKYPVAPERKVQ